MAKHTINLKETIEYKKYFNSLLAILIIAIIYTLAIILASVWFSLGVPPAYSIPFIICTLLVCSPFLFVFSHYLVKFHKKLAFMKNHYDEYTELTIKLDFPIEVSFNKVKFLIKITISDNKQYEIVTDTYSNSQVNRNKMLIGFNEKYGSIIFLKKYD